MHFVKRLIVLALVGWTALAARAQVRPYVGFVYPAGGQQGSTFQVRLGGQGLEDVNAVLVSGSGVTAKIVECRRRLNNQETTLLSEQLKELKRATSSVASAMAPMMASETTMASDSTMMMSAAAGDKAPRAAGKSGEAQRLIARIEKTLREYVQTPACASIATLTIVEVTVAPDAEPGEREIRLATLRGVSNPLVFCVGQVPEYARKPMLTATLQVLGKEAQSLRKRPAEEIEDRVNLPCTVNGQIASGEVNRYRFAARRGQRLVVTTLARQLVPFIADAVPGWFQPVLCIYDAQGKEVAYDDDYRFKPDPTILFEVPQDGDYVFEIRDSIYRGREDFVYRITAGELPFVTSLFPLGGQVGVPAAPRMQGWNLDEATLTPPLPDAPAGVYPLVATRKGVASNRTPFALDTLPEGLEQEPNNDPAHAQKVTLPTILNGRMDRPDDWDVFQFVGRSNDTVVAEVLARRLDSPLDSVLKLTDAKGALLAFNDDREDLGSGLNTHHADSYLTARLPANGTYFIHLGDTGRKGGDAFAYRLRLSAPRPDFELRAVPSSVSLRPASTATVSVYALRKDGFNAPVKLALKDPPTGFSAFPVTLWPTQAVARFTFKCGPAPTKEPVNLAIVGSARIGDQEIAHTAIPAEDRMQAFLWRHLVPAKDLAVLVFDPASELPPKRVAPPCVPPALPTNTVAAAISTTNSPAGTNAATLAAKSKFTKSQISGRLRQLKLLFQDDLLTEEFYCEKVAECAATP